jgi:hypothetical protein
MEAPGETAFNPLFRFCYFSNLLILNNYNKKVFFHKKQIPYENVI